jgi:serine O-acetyltransferase
MFDKIRADFRAVFEMDPAATSKLEVLFTYSGFHALLAHRIAHWFHRMGMPFFARALSQTARLFTGIEIHPGAKIGGSLFIDHGMGVVIGETTEIGEHCLLFQGVTLGGTGKERGKRHPTLGNYVVVGAGAKVLGGITIGDRVKIGANAVVLTSVPPHSTVVGVPGRVVRVHGEKTAEAAMLDHLHMPDPLNETLTRMQKQISRLEGRFEGQPSAQPSSQPSSRKQEPRKRGGAPSSQQKPVKPVELPSETVQERQARMARMEKDERMKFRAIKKSRDLAQAEHSGESEPPAEAAPHKKRVRRRRRGKKPEGQSPSPQEGGEAMASEAQSASAAEVSVGHDSIDFE